MKAQVERFATEIRHLQRTEVLEVENFWKKKNKKDPLQCLTKKIQSLVKI